jgi:hypothetical protein
MRKLFLAVLLVSLSGCALAQQDYVGRNDVFVAFSYLDTPQLNLKQRGFVTQEGININRWLAFGFDYSVMDGHASFLPGQLKPALQQELAGLPLPPGYKLYVPYNATTSTYTAGPQINYRKFKKVTLFVHPNFGAIHEDATARPVDPIQKAVVGVLAPKGKISDTTYFLGVGVGAQYHFTKHVGVRFTFDLVHLNLFSDLLASGRNAYRFGIGTYFNIGRNVSK